MSGHYHTHLTNVVVVVVHVVCNQEVIITRLFKTCCGVITRVMDNSCFYYRLLSQHVYAIWWLLSRKRWTMYWLVPPEILNNIMVILREVGHPQRSPRGQFGAGGASLVLFWRCFRAALALACAALATLWRCDAASS